MIFFFSKTVGPKLWKKPPAVKRENIKISFFSFLAAFLDPEPDMHNWDKHRKTATDIM
jgi:hypothetical protein